MATIKNQFVQNLEIKCRCCFKKFRNITESIKITRTIEKQIREITNMEVNIVIYFDFNMCLINDFFKFKISPLYPSSICKSCSVVLKETSAFRNGLIKRQEKLYNLINIDSNTENDAYDDNLKQEDEFHFSDPIKMEVEMKMECFEKPNIIIFEAPVLDTNAYGNKLFLNLSYWSE